MSLAATIVVLMTGLALFVGANYMSRKPTEPGTSRHIPWLGLQFIGLIVVVLMLAHLVTLLTGTPLEGRYAAYRPSDTELMR